MEHKKEIIVICAHTLDRQTRLTKIIKTLSGDGYSITYLGWDRSLNPPRSEEREAGEFQRKIMMKLKSKLGNSSAIQYPIWWIFVFFQLMTNKWDIAHVGGFTSIFPVVIASILKNKIVVYEIMDTFADTLVLPSIIRDLLIKLDKLFMYFSSAVILADEMQIEEYCGIPITNVTIYDSPNIIAKIDKCYQKNEIFTLFFAGFLSSSKALNIDKIIVAIDSIDNVKLIIAGYGDLLPLIKSWSSKMPSKVEFIGEIQHAEVLEQSHRADLLFVLREIIIPENKYICGSKVLEAMMCGTPIIVNKGTSTAKKVLKAKCGIVVDANNILELRNAIIKLRDDPAISKILGENGQRAFEEQYSWKIMSQRLLDLYNKL
jgi:glycosyltransferase involved in cell wall biosynthesis